MKEDLSVLLPVNPIPHVDNYVNKNLPMKQQNKFEEMRKNTADS